MVRVKFFIRMLNYNPEMKWNMASSDYHKSLVTGKLLEQRPRKKHLQNGMVRFEIKLHHIWSGYIKTKDLHHYIYHDGQWEVAVQGTVAGSE